jgi:glycosyltransferase involved in cell wall biosynthesis
MRIALIVPGFSANADDWCIPALRHLVRRLATTEEVHVLALRYPYRSGCYRLFGAEITALGGRQRRKLASLGLWARAVKVLASEHRRRPFDVLHGFWANETGAVTALAGKLLGVPSLVSLAGGELVKLPDIGYGDQQAWTERLKIRLALRLADSITAGSQRLLERAAPWLEMRPPGTVYHAPLGVNLDLFCPSPEIVTADTSHNTRRSVPRIVHAASLTPVKDQATLLRAVAVMHQAGVGLTLEIAGSGPMEAQLRALSKTLGLQDSVRFVGDIPHHELVSFYQQGAILAHSSRYEAQSMVVLEAAACGLPVVSTRVGVVPELGPEAAIAVPVGDAPALAAALVEVLQNPARREEMGRAARQKAEASFGLASCTRRFRCLYATLVEQREQEERRYAA